MPHSLSVSQIADKLGGTVIGDGNVIISGFAAAAHARDGDLTFADQPKFLAAALQSDASAIIVENGAAGPDKPLIQVPNARVAVARILPFFHPEEPVPAGIDPSASVAKSASVDPSAAIGPHCVIHDNVTIGANCVLHGGNHIRKNSRLGDNVVLHPNVVVYPDTQIGNRVVIHAGTVIGSDGYGYVFDQGRHRKMLQVGHVVIEDDVEIGSNTSIDRGALGPTTIGQGTKIDNLVHVAHNVTIGKHNLIMGQCGFAGSTTLHDYCVIASQSGVAGHLNLGPQATVGARSGVLKDIPPKGTVLGYPAQPDKQMKRQVIALTQLPDLLKRFRAMEKMLAELESGAPES